MQPFSVLILGSSGSGKSTAIETLPPSETFLINVCRKPLPFRGSNKMYTEYEKTNNPQGNKLTSDQYDLIMKSLRYVSEKRENIRYIVIDDSQYLMVNEFMRLHSLNYQGKEVYDVYNDIADHFWSLVWEAGLLRDNLITFFLHHTEYDEKGYVIPRTIGRLLKERVDIAGMFTFVLLAKREIDKNYFYTQNDGSNPAKTPRGMFEELKIPNDLQIVADKIINYYEGE